MKKFLAKLTRFQKLYFSSLVLFLIVLPVVGLTTGMFSATPVIFEASPGSSNISSAFGQAAVTQINTAIGSTVKLPSNSFTLEAWINNPYKSDPTKKQFIFGKATTRSYQTIVDGPPLLDYSLYVTSSSIVATYYDLNSLQTIRVNTGITLNEWQHLALVKDGSTAKLFLNGELITSTTSVPGSNLSPSATDSADRIIKSSTLYIAGHPEYHSFHGWIDEVRISSVARYTKNFSPVLNPFETDDNTLALYHLDGNPQDTVNPSVKLNLIGQIEYIMSSITPCEPNYLISFSVSQPCGGSNFEQVNFKCQQDVPPMPGLKTDTCQSISQWFEYTQSRCQQIEICPIEPTPQPTPIPSPSPQPTPIPSPQPTPIPSPSPQPTPIPSPQPTSIPSPSLQPTSIPIPPSTPISNQAPVIETTSLPTSKVGQQYKTTVRAYDNDQEDLLSINISGLPGKLNIAACTDTYENNRHYYDCLISGILIKAGTYPINIEVKDNHSNNAQVTLNLRITQPLPDRMRQLYSCARQCRRREGGGTRWGCYKSCL